MDETKAFHWHGKRAGRIVKPEQLEVRCPRCGTNPLLSAVIVVDSKGFCMACVFLILREWAIKKTEVDEIKIS